MVQQLFSDVQDVKAEIRRLRGRLDAVLIGSTFVVSSSSSIPTPVQGAMIYGTSAPAWARLAAPAPAAGIRDVIGFDNGDTIPAWKVALDNTNPTSINFGDAAGPGTSLVFARRDHAHGMASETAHAILSARHSDSTAAAAVRGDIITAQGVSPTWSRLAKGSLGDVLTMGANEPAWAAPVGGSHAILSATHSDSTAAAAVAGDIIIADATPKWTRLGIGSNGDVLTLNAGLPSWQPPGGGTTHAILSATHTDSTAAAVQRGDIITGQGVSPTWARLAKGSSGDVLTMGANEPAWSAPTAVAHAMLSATHSDSTAAAVQRGDIITGQGASPAWVRLAKGTSGQVLTMGADEPEWADAGGTLTEEVTGTTTTDGTEQSLDSSLSGKEYQFFIDTHNMVNGDAIEIRVYNKVLGASTKRLALPIISLANVQGDPNHFTEWLAAAHYYEVSIKRVASSGGDKSYDWSILSR